jgi:hypothetical protein
LVDPSFFELDIKTRFLAAGIKSFQIFFVSTWINAIQKYRAVTVLVVHFYLVAKPFLARVEGCGGERREKIGEMWWFKIKI